MPFDPNNPFKEDELAPTPDMRAQLLASLQARMAPVPPPDVSDLESRAAGLRSQSGIARAGLQIGNAFMGRNVDGDNQFSKNLDADAQMLLAEGLERKRQASEADRRREELRNSLSTRFVDDENLRGRDKIKAEGEAANYTRDLGDKRTDAEAEHKRALELAKINNRNKFSIADLKNTAAADKASQLSDKQLDALQGYEDTLDLIGRIEVEKPNQDTGKWASFTNKTAQQVGIDDPKTSGFRALVGTNLAAYIKEMSGAAASDQERAFLMENQPTFQDSDATFNEKLGNLKAYVKGKQENKLVMLKGNKKDVSDLQPKSRDDQPVPSGAPAVSVDAKKARLEELRAKKKAAQQ